MIQLSFSPPDEHGRWAFCMILISQAATASYVRPFMTQTLVLGTNIYRYSVELVKVVLNCKSAVKIISKCPVLFEYTEIFVQETQHK
jgi:hypothetical protein